LESLHLFAVVCRPLLDKQGTTSGLEEGGGVTWSHGHVTHHEDAEHHVVVVHEEDQLVSPGGKLSRHLQHEVLHLHLEHTASSLGYYIIIIKYNIYNTYYKNNNNKKYYNKVLHLEHTA